MEATAQQGVGEVRRLHIIYFISRKGRIEHPHLIRVHHLSRNGVRLRGTQLASLVCIFVNHNE